MKNWEWLDTLSKFTHTLILIMCLQSDWNHTEFFQHGKLASFDFTIVCLRWKKSLCLTRVHVKVLAIGCIIMGAGHYESDLKWEWLWQIEGHMECLNLISSSVMISLSLYYNVNSILLGPEQTNLMKFSCILKQRSVVSRGRSQSMREREREREQSGREGAALPRLRDSWAAR